MARTQTGIGDAQPRTRRRSRPRAPEIGVIGAGIMGRGIAQLFSQSGARVRLLDAAPGAAAAAVEAIDQVWAGLATKGRLEDSARRSHRERLGRSSTN